MSDVIKLVIAIPSAGMVRMGFAYSLAGLVGYLGADAIPSRPESTLEVKLDVVESSVIHTNREKLVRRAIDSGMTHLAFLDDDMVFEPNILDVMLGRRQPVVCTNYLIKTDACDSFVAVGLDDKRVPTTEKSRGIRPIAYSGFGVSVFEVDVFKNTPQPWFLPKFMPEDNGYTTEDNPFYERVRNAGYKVYLDQDASKMVSHLGNSSWNYKEYKHG